MTIIPGDEQSVDSSSSMVRTVSTEAAEGRGLRAAGKKIGLALSGGGFRATLFHLGLVRFLHDAGILKDVTTISSEIHSTKNTIFRE